MRGDAVAHVSRHCVAIVKTHLHSYKLGHFAIWCLDGCHGQQVPEWRAILAVIEQAHTDRLALLDSLTDLLHLLRVCALAL